MIETKDEEKTEATSAKKKSVKRGPSKKIEALEEELDGCREKVNEWEDKFLRLAADYDNYSRSGRRDIE